MASRPIATLLGTWLRLLLYQGAGVGLAMATAALAAVAVPPAVYGEYGLLLSIVQVASGVALSWVNQGLLRIGREEFGRRGTSADTLAAAMALLAMLVIALLAAAVALGPLLARATGLPLAHLAVIAPCLLAFVLFETMSYAAQANGRLEGFTGGQVLARCGPFAGVALMLYGWGSDAVFLIACAGIGWVVAASFAGAAALANGVKPTPAWRSQISRIVAYGRLLPIASAAGMLSAWMGLWFVRGHAGLAEAGVLLWSMGVFSLLTGVLQPFSAILAPRMIDLKLADDKATLQRGIDVMLAAALLLAALMPLALSGLRMLFAAAVPGNYASATPLLVVLLSALPALLVAATLSPLLGAFESILPRLVALHATVSALNFCLLSLLVVRVGALGAALASTLAVTATTAGCLLLFQRVMGGRGISRRRWLELAVVGLLPPAFALLLSAAGGAWGLTAGALASLALILGGRGLASFRALAALAPQLVHTPVLRAPAFMRLIEWVSRAR